MLLVEGATADASTAAAGLSFAGISLVCSTCSTGLTESTALTGSTGSTGVTVSGVRCKASSGVLISSPEAAVVVVVLVDGAAEAVVARASTWAVEASAAAAGSISLAFSSGVAALSGTACSGSSCWTASGLVITSGCFVSTTGRDLSPLVTLAEEAEDSATDVSSLSSDWVGVGALGSSSASKAVSLTVGSSSSTSSGCEEIWADGTEVTLSGAVAGTGAVDSSSKAGATKKWLILLSSSSVMGLPSLARIHSPSTINLYI